VNKALAESNSAFARSYGFARLRAAQRTPSTKFVAYKIARPAPPAGIKP
jgi:hypothetical protein